MVDNDALRTGPVWTPGARLEGFIKMTAYTLLHTKYESSGLCGFGEEVFFLYFPIVRLWELMTPRAGPFLTTGAWLAGFKKRITIHCNTQNMKALGFVISEMKIFFPSRPRGGACLDPRGTIGRIHKENNYTFLHTKYQSSRSFSHCKFMGAICCHGNQSSNPTWPKT